MALFWKKQESVSKKIQFLILAVNKCRDVFRPAIEKLIREGPTAENQEAAERVHDAEARVDDIIREIEYDLYNRALIPESRGDVLGVLEALDKIPDTFQTVSYKCSLERIEIPLHLQEKYLHLVDINLEAYDLVSQAIMCLFEDRNLKELKDEIDKTESRSDKIERDLIMEIFVSDMDKADKILLRELVLKIGNISNYSEAINDRLVLAIIKRRI